MRWPACGDASSAEEDLGGAAGRREHAGGVAIGEEVADVLALWAAVVVVLERPTVIAVLGAHVQRVAAGRVDGHRALGRRRLQSSHQEHLSVTHPPCMHEAAEIHAAQTQHSKWR